MTYSVHLIDGDGQGPYLSVKGRTFWGKRTALKHARDIASTKAPLYVAWGDGQGMFFRAKDR